MPLPRILHAGPHQDGAIRQRAYFRAFGGGAARRMDMESNRGAAKQPRIRAVGLALPIPRPVGQFDNALGQLRIVATIHDLSDTGRVGKLFWPDQISAAQFERVDTNLPRRQVDQPLQGRCGFRLGRPAIGIDRRRIGQHRAGPVFEAGNIVGLIVGPDGIHGDNGRGGGVQERAHVRNRLDAEGQKAPICVQRQSAAIDPRAPSRIADEGFGTRSDPLHGPVQLPRGYERQDMLGIGPDLHGKAAADVVGEDTQVFGRNAQAGRQGGAKRDDPLTRRRQGEHAFSVRFGEAPARLDGRDTNPRMAHFNGNHVRGRGNHPVGLGPITLQPMERRVLRHLGPDHRPVGRRDRVGDRRVLIDIQSNCLCRVQGLRGCLGNDCRYRLADICDLGLGQHRSAWFVEDTIDGIFERRAQPQGSDAQPIQIGRGQDRPNTGHVARLGDIQPGDGPVRDLRAQHDHVQHPGPALIVDEAARSHE